MSGTSSTLNTVTEENAGILHTLVECLEDDEEIKEVEEDMELLELKDSEVGGNIVFQIEPSKQEVSSPRPGRTSPRRSSTNRRYTLRPQKKPESTECDNFTSSSRKITKPIKHCSLETIFENPIFKNGSLTLLGKQKLKRYLSFDTFVSKTKLRHRKLKLKRLAKGKRKTTKVSIEEVKLKLKSLEEEEDEWIDIQ